MFYVCSNILTKKNENKQHTISEIKHSISIYYYKKCHNLGKLGFINEIYQTCIKMTQI